MTKDEFHKLLERASLAAIDFARQYVADELPKNLRFHLLLNQSCDDESTTDDRVYPEDKGKDIIEDTQESVIKHLLRDGKCPQWIDVSVEATGNDFTLIELICCGRYTSDPAKMYYHDRGMGPFGIKSPVLPPDYDGKTKFMIKKKSNNKILGTA
jgi:hypothetical protein